MQKNSGKNFRNGHIIKTKKKFWEKFRNGPIIKTKKILGKIFQKI